jgi:alpha-1,2-mannosyltransferase
MGLVVVAVLVVVGFAGPWGARMLDLDVYRMGADALLTGNNLYDVRYPISNLYFTYPVFAAMLFVPFQLLPLGVAKVLVTLISFGGLAVIVYLTVGWVRRAIGARTGGSTLAWTVALSVLAVGVHPVWETFTFGQVNLILVAFVLIDVLPADRGRLRGVLVGIAAGIKLVPGLFILYFLVTGQRRAALTSIATTAATMLVGFAVQPSQAWAFWTRYALDPGRTGGIAYVTNQSLLGMSARLLREPHPPRGLTLALGAIAVAAALWAARRFARDKDTLTAVSVIGVASLLASPVSWSHHWVWAVPVLGTLVIWAHGQARWRWVVFAVIAAIVATGPMQFTPKEQLRELHDTLSQQVVANIFGLLAVVYLVWTVVRAARSSGSAGADPQAPATSVTAAS